MKQISLLAGIAALMVATAPQAAAVPTPHTEQGIPSGGVGGIHPNATFASAEEFFHPGLNPVGTNDFSCQPAEGQPPVVLIPGTGGSAFSAFSSLAPQLKAQGRCVYTFNHNPLGHNTQMSFVGDIAESARMLGSVVDRVLASTGAEQVDLVGWSQGGGPMAVYYLNKLGGAPKVHKVVGIVPSHHGTNFWWAHEHAERVPGVRERYDAMVAPINGLALTQQLAGSEFVSELYSEPVKADYMNIASQHDQVVLPYQHSFLPGADNRLVQDYCPGRRTNHFNATYDPVVISLVLEGLTGVPHSIDCEAPVPLG